MSLAAHGVTHPGRRTTNEDAFAYLTIAVKDPDPKKVGRVFSGTVVEMALASYPGFFGTGVPGVLNHW